MSDNLNQNGWNEYSKLVLKELESLADGMDNLNKEISDLRADITEIKAREDRVEELRVWKGKMDDVVSPTQLKELMSTVTELEGFKIKSVGIFLTVQFLMGLAAWYLNILVVLQSDPLRRLSLAITRKKPDLHH